MSEKSPFGFHEGPALIRLAGTYPTLQEVVSEGIQNAIDKNATRIRVAVDYQSRIKTIAIEDNGDGVSREEFERALTSVCDSIKKDDKLGRFGLGLISPLGKCESFSFTSTTKRDPRGYLEWSFVTEDLGQKKEIDGIPVKPRPDLWCGNYSGSKAMAVNWRTRVFMERFTKDRLVNKMTLESLRDVILEKYSLAMRRKDMIVSLKFTDRDGNKSTLEVKAPEFDGTKLPDYEILLPQGRTNFHLFLARRSPGKNDKVQVGEYGNDFRIGFATFLKSLPDECKISVEATSALVSGIFSGEIVNNKVKIHSNRRSFEVNEALGGLCQAIDKWFTEEGHKHFREAQEQRQSQRYQNIGRRSLAVFEGMRAMDDACRQFLEDAFRTFKYGTIGVGHVERSGTESDLLALSVQGRHRKDSGGNGSGERERNEPEAEKLAHRPLVVAGPRGQRRTVVKSNSLGLQLVHDLLDSERLWILDEDSGTLTLNVRHPLWVECSERSDKVLMKFQEHVILQALSLQRINDESWRDMARLVFDEFNRPFVFTLIHGDTLAERVPNRSSKKNKVVAT